MTDFQFWQNEAGKQGRVMCMLCFEIKNIGLMYKDKDGDVWDTCLDCKAYEDTVIKERGLPPSEY